MNLVFVYGTLKRGGANHQCLHGQKFLGDARTVAGFTLYTLGDYPGMVRVAGDTVGVTGELWLVNDAGLTELDRLEGTDEGLYERVEVPLAPNSIAKSAQAYLYCRQIGGHAAIGSTWPVGPAT